MAGLNQVAVKAVIKGTLATGAQDFSYGFWLNVGDVDFIGQSQLDTITGDVHDAIDTMHNTSSVAALMTSADVVTGVTCYSYNATSVTADLVSIAPLTTPRAGSGTANHPKETSLVTSLRTLIPGRSGRGRFYMPATGIAMTAGGVIASNTAVDDFADAVKTMFDDLGSATWAVSVASFSKGHLYPVTSFQVDNKPDTQRRRTDKINATHTKIESF